MKVFSLSGASPSPSMAFLLVIGLLVPWSHVVREVSVSAGEEQEQEGQALFSAAEVPFNHPPIPVPERGPEYVIICPRDFVNASLPLSEHRTRLGLASRTYALEDILDRYEAYDDAAEVHTFLRDLHSEHPSFKWLLILADSEHLMPRQLWHYAEDRGQPFGNYYHSDVYYAGLDSSWDTNGNHMYGEISVNGTVEGDLDWDLYVGRVPASDPDQARDFVQKLLRYERNPPVGTWMKRFLNWGSLMEPPNLDSGVYSYQSYKSNAYKVGKKVEANLPGHLILRSLYDYPQLEAGAYVPNDGRDTLDRSHMLSELNGGASMLNFAGQARYLAYALNDYGPPTGYGTEYDWNEPLLYSDWSQLTNSDMLPFMYASSCDVAKFFQSGYWEDKSFETFLTAPTGGFIGLISSTGTSARGEEQNRSWGNWYLDEEFWKLFLNKNETRPGRTLFMLKENYEADWFSPTILVKETILGMIYAYVLLGDPYTDIYTDTAKRFMLQGAIKTPFYQGNHTVRLQVKDRDLSPVPYPSVTFHNPDIFHNAVGNGEGWVNVTLDLKQGTDLNITLSKHNMVPSFYKVQLLSEIADLAVSPSDVGFTPSVFGAGENVTVSVLVRNLGGMDAQDVSLTARTLSAEGDPDRDLPPAQLGMVPGRGSVQHRWTWKGRPGELRFQIRVQTSSPQIDPFNDLAEVTVFTEGPHLRFEQGSGVVTPSQKARPFSPSEMAFSILNEGPGAGAVQLGIYMGDPHSNGTLMVPMEDLGVLDSGQWSNGTIRFQFPNSTGLVYLIMDPLDLFPPSMTDPPIKQLIEADRPPYLALEEEVRLLEDAGPVETLLEEVVIDPDTPWDELQLDIGSTEGLAVQTNDGPRGRVLLIEPLRDWNGTGAVLIEVEDGSGPVELSIPVRVLPVNDPPVFLDGLNGILELTILEDILHSIWVRAFDIEGDALLFSTGDSPFTLDPSSGRLEWIPDNLDVGTEDHTITVDDGHGGQSTLILRITVVGVNDPPVVGMVDDITLKAGESRSVDISVEDEEGGPFSLTSDSPMVAPKGQNGIYVNGSKDHLGRNAVHLSVSDGVNTVIIAFNVTVTPGTDDDSGKKGSPVGDQMVLAALGIALVLFSVLLITFMVIRKTRADRVVSREKEEADRRFLQAVEGSEDETEGLVQEDGGAEG